MTAQIPDTYRYKSKVYEIVAMTNPIGFDPRNYGLEPHSSCTACWRGYWCEYAIKYGKLIMERLLLYNQDGNYPDFNGVHVSPQEYKEIEYREAFDEGEKLKKKTIPYNWGHRTYNVNMKYDEPVQKRDGKKVRSLIRLRKRLSTSLRELQTRRLF